jgi:hypothetical protein
MSGSGDGGNGTRVRAVIALAGLDHCGGGLSVGLGGPLDGLGVHLEAGQVGQQASGRGERDRRTGPVDHRAQSRGRRGAGHPQLDVPRCQAVPADTTVVPGT